MMNQKELVHISDCTLMEAEQHFELSFREKIELCRIVDKLGVDTINLYQIRHKKTDRLLVKSICSAVKPDDAIHSSTYFGTVVTANL